MRDYVEKEDMAAEENLKNKKYILFKSEMLVLKVLPMVLAFLALLSTIFDRYEINSVILNYIMFFTVYLFLYLSSYVFKFCEYHRMFLHYIVLTNIISIYDVYVGIPLNYYSMFRLYLVITGIFAFIILYMYVKSHKKSTTESD